MSGTTIKVIVTDDHKLFTEGICALFDNDKDIQITSVYHNGNQLLKELHRTEADVLLLDVKMGQPSGMEVLAELAKRNSPLKTIMLSTYSDPAIMIGCKKMGAAGYLLKNTSRAELKSSIRKVIQGETAFEQLENTQKSEEDKYRYCHEHYKITRREWEILLLIKKQHTNQMISETLHLSIYTVETHRKNLMHKLQLKSPLLLHQFIQLHDI